MNLAVEWDVKLKSQAYFIQILAYARLLSYNIKNNKKKVEKQPGAKFYKESVMLHTLFMWLVLGRILN